MAQATEAIKTEEKDRSKYRAMDIIPLLRELQAKQAASRDMFNKEAAERLEQKGNIDGAGMTAQEILLAVARRTNEALIETQKAPSEARAATEREVIELLNIAIPKVKEREARLLHKTKGKAQLTGIIDLYGLEAFNPKNAWHQLNKLSLEAEGLTQISITLGTAWAYATPEMKALVKNNQVAIADILKAREDAARRAELTKAYSVTRNGPANYELARQDMRLSPSTKPDLSGNRAINKGHLKIVQEKYNITPIKTGVSPQAQMLLDIMIGVMFDTGSREVSFTIRDYMKKRGLSDFDTARAQVDGVFEELSRVVYYEPLSDRPYLRIGIHAGSDIVRGRAYFRFTELFEEMTHYYSPLFLPVKAFLGDLRKNPNRYLIIRRIAVHTGINLSNPNEKIISVASLLEACPGIPTFEEVATEGRQRPTQLIAEPFLRDLDAARDTYHLRLTGEKGKPAPEPKNGKAYTYEELIGLYVCAEPIDPEHPAQTNLREKRQIAKAARQVIEAPKVIEALL